MTENIDITKTGKPAAGEKKGSLANPTAYFFNQNSNITQEEKAKIDDFVSKLINLKQCVLCHCDFDLAARTPRILIHCGHTFCSTCLHTFHKNCRVRCPLCLKLVKNIDTVERLPVNHTIFTKLAGTAGRPLTLPVDRKAWKPSAPAPLGVVQNNYIGAPDAMALGEEETNLPPCEVHGDRIKHFYCLTHKVDCCRACTELKHSGPKCSIVDLYDLSPNELELLAKGTVGGKDSGLFDDGEVNNQLNNSL